MIVAQALFVQSLAPVSVVELTSRVALLEMFSACQYPAPGLHPSAKRLELQGTHAGNHGQGHRSAG